ncbi:MAG: succinylglutamate desuccinylase/aspartoacylase family protein [Spirochaetia bacterium]|nr:succinylglutamate desuccinylase/aspartoacylase family protein [Spirochaetia bacterium]
MENSLLIKKPRIKQKRLSILTGSDLSIKRLALIEHDSGLNGPVVWLTACIHGDEVGGIAIVHEVLSFLRKNPLLRGKVFAFPILNAMAFEVGTRDIPITNEDLNRSFPGSMRGTVGERTAHKIFSTIVDTHPTLVLDLHNDWLRSIPYIILDSGKIESKESYKIAAKIGRKTNLPLVKEPFSQKSNELVNKTLVGNLLLNDIPALTLELGTSQIVDEKHVSLGVYIILEILKSLQMIDVNLKMPEEIKNNFSNKIYIYNDKPYFSQTGLIRYLAKPGQLILKGKPFASLYNVFGKLTETLFVENDSLILGHNDSSVGIPGNPVAAFAQVISS